MNKLKFASELIAIQSKILQNCFVTGVMLSMSTQLQLHRFLFFYLLFDYVVCL